MVALDEFGPGVSAQFVKHDCPHKIDAKDRVQSHIERVHGASKTWSEWVDKGHDFLKVLVSEVDFDTDPNAGLPVRGD